MGIFCSLLACIVMPRMLSSDTIAYFAALFVSSESLLAAGGSPDSLATDADIDEKRASAAAADTDGRPGFPPRLC